MSEPKTSDPLPRLCESFVMKRTRKDADIRHGHGASALCSRPT
jgi:hypothetical protein